jgi:hypothetical protein
MDRRDRGPAGPVTARGARELIAALDPRGAWVESGTLRAEGTQRAPAQVIESRTFMRNIRALASYAGPGR